MADLGALTVTIGADASTYIAAVQAAKAAIKNFADQNNASLSEASAALRKFAAEAKNAAKASDDAAKGTISGLGTVVDIAKGAAAAFVALAVAVGGFADVAIDAANLMDPAGAEKWNASIMKLKDAWIGLIAPIGEQLRPALESLMATMINVIHTFEALNFKQIADDVAPLKIVLGSLANAALSMLTPFKAIYDVAKSLFSLIDQASGGKVSTALGAAASAVSGAITGRYGPAPGAKGGTNGDGTDDHPKSVAELNLINQSQLRVIQEQTKAERLRQEAATAVYDKAKQQVAIEKEGADETSALRKTSAQSAYDLSNKTFADQMTMLKAQQATDVAHAAAFKTEDISAEAAATKMRDAAAAELAAHRQTVAGAAVAAAHKTVETFASAPEDKAKAEGVIARYKAEETQQSKLLADLQKSQNAIDEAHLAARKDASAAEISAAKDAAAILKAQDDDRRRAIEDDIAQQLGAADRRAAAAESARNAQLDAAQHAFNIGNGSAGSGLTLDEAKVAAAKDAAAWDVKGAQAKLDAAKEAFSVASDKSAAQEEIDKAQAALKAAQAAGDQKIDDAKANLAKAQNDYQKVPQHQVENTAVAAAGAGSGVISAGIQGGMTGGPMGAIVGVVTALLQMSETFKQIQAALGTVFQSLADAVGKMATPMLWAITGLKALAPVFAVLGIALMAIQMVALGPLTVVFAVLGVLGSLFGPLAQAIGKVISSMVSGGGISKGLDQIGQLIGYIGQSLTQATQIFDPVSEVMETFVQAFGATFGPIIGKLGNSLTEIASILQSSFAPVLPVLEQMFSTIAQMIAGPLSSALGTAFKAFVDMAGVLLHFAGWIEQGLATIVGAVIGLLADIDNFASSIGLGSPLLGAIIGLTQVFTVLNEVSSASFEASNALNAVTWNSVSSQIALAASTEAINQQLTNLPASFNVAQAYNQAIAGGGIGAGSGFQAGMSTGFSTTISGDTVLGGTTAGTVDNSQQEYNDQHDPGANQRALRLNRGGGSSGGPSFVNCEFTVVANDPQSLMTALSQLNSQQGNGRTMAPLGRVAKQEMTLR